VPEVSSESPISIDYNSNVLNELPTGLAAESPVTGRVKGRVARAVETLLHLHDSPERTAAAFALGVFFSFSPFLGLQILLSMALAFLLGLNRLAVFVGLNANLPWFLVPWYAGLTLAAAAILGMPVTSDSQAIIDALFSTGWTLPDVARVVEHVRPILVPFLVGPTIGAGVVGVSAYWATRAVLVRRRAGALGA
jgi:uncharacterized protein (DUF2062 family)